MKKTDIQIISQLRQNGRASLTELSRKTKLPVTTIHDRLKCSTETELLKPTVLLNFDKIGYSTKAHILLTVEPAEKDKLLAHLNVHPNVNSLFKINNGWHIMMESVFKDMIALEAFIEEIENKFHIKQKQVHYVLEELRREGFTALLS